MNNVYFNKLKIKLVFIDTHLIKYCNRIVENQTVLFSLSQANHFFLLLSVTKKKFLVVFYLYSTFIFERWCDIFLRSLLTNSRIHNGIHNGEFIKSCCNKISGRPPFLLFFPDFPSVKNYIS